MKVLFRKSRKSVASDERGSIVVTILTLTIFLTVSMSALAVMAASNVSRARGRILLLQAQYSAESGADAAISTLNNIDSNYAGTGATAVQVLSTSRYKSTYTTTVSLGSSCNGNTGCKERVITATGNVYSPANATTPRYTRKIRVTAQRSSTTTASSMMSRNLLTIASSVKDIFAKDIYVNGYITMNKNTTNLYAENITVGGKNTGATNCSIGGTGNLFKPASFTTPGQTKTKLKLAYNNCISPPGNTSNSDFDISVNQTNISTVQSLYIPWGQYMDSSYQNSPGGCSDWTTGSNPRDIPSTGNTKKTHYPDSSSNIATSCGTNGDLDLGSNQYNIRDNVHIRANLCASNGCSPTFYNPTSNLYFVFVEGTINFNQVKTASGSGPIVFVTYGADPASKTAVCPTGGATYIGQQGSNNTNAPAAYFLGVNGVCLDGTKFDASPGLGGIAGKNLYVATQQGQPFYLTMDPNFPTSQIPIDLAWRETGYERL